MDKPTVLMKDIPIANIHKGERYRKDYGDLEEFKKSIEEQGLLQPIVVTNQQVEGQEPYLLLAGGRRLKACEELGWTQIPARIFSVVDELTRRTIELMENLQRKQFDFMEEIELKNEIHSLYVAKYGEKQGRSGTGWSGRDTARLLGVSSSGLASDLKIAQAAKVMPELKTVKTKKDAISLTNKMMEKILLQELTSRKQGSLPKIQLELIDSYIIGDFLVEGHKLPDKTFDLIDFDPPYFVERLPDKMAKEANKSLLEENFAVFSQHKETADLLAFADAVLALCRKKAKENCWLITWLPLRAFPQMQELMRKHKFRPRSVPGMWLKYKKQAISYGANLFPCAEFFLYGSCGAPYLNDPDHSSAFEYKHNWRRAHPTEKPVEMMQEVLQTFVPPSARILVPCLGSGNTLLAAANIGMSGVGFDISNQFKPGFIEKASLGNPGDYKTKRTGE